ncbi:MAG: LexA repressor [Candidatus Wolfebacteria bacterium GW2011_GWC2_39_22]|uniref:LexA repressor n=1 Tax=Candidatus Wolfebacteria bacterium GW2011_GWC2_39_22 TaxID=1619013 RepID=A0A0G0NB93_9BACT|nr:MAG: LexA repressor [Candidatus Wolfebacteria bacterium GW2011_GWC2_39_22]HBI25601.1 hypothetical protein [Candidatus Wolfebacteria bacterium]
MTKPQKQIVELYEKNGGVLPSFREIARQIGVASTNTVSYHIDQLRKKGYLDIGRSPQGIANLSLKTVFALDAKPGVYVMLCAGKPFTIGSTTNMRKHILETVVGVNTSSPFPEVRAKLEQVTIAFHIIENEQERADLKQHLSDYYRTKGIEI